MERRINNDCGNKHLMDFLWSTGNIFNTFKNFQEDIAFVTGKYIRKELSCSMHLFFMTALCANKALWLVG